MLFTLVWQLYVYVTAKLKAYELRGKDRNELLGRLEELRNELNTVGEAAALDASLVYIMSTTCF